MKSPLFFLVLNISLPLYCMTAVKEKTQIKLCNTCYKSPAFEECEKLSRCGACKAVYYCSEECQRRDYEVNHKEKCKKLKELPVKINQELLNRKLNDLVKKDANPEHIRRLVQAGADVDAPSSSHIYEGQTPLSVACSKGYLAIAETLLACGAEVDTLKGNYRPLTPLMRASLSGHYEICELLLQHGASATKVASYKEDPGDMFFAEDRRHTDKYCFNTALSYAVERNNLGTARLLLEHGAHRVINLTTSNAFNSLLGAVYGRTPFFMALNAKNSEMCLLLLRYGAFVDALEQVNREGNDENALELAAQYGLPEVCRAILIRALSLHPQITEELKVIMDKAHEKASSEEVRKVVTLASVEELVGASLDEEVLPMKPKEQVDKATFRASIIKDNGTALLEFYNVLTLTKEEYRCLSLLKTQNPMVHHICALESVKVEGEEENLLAIAAKNNMPQVCSQLIMYTLVSHSFEQIEAKLKAIMQQAYDVAASNAVRKAVDFEVIKRARKHFLIHEQSK